MKVTRTYCDRCGAVCEQTEERRLVVFREGVQMDFCEDCYKELEEWMKCKERSNDD